MTWRKKTLDSLNVESMLDALLRFEVVPGIVKMNPSLLWGREFFVDDCDSRSITRPQISGVSQSCTISPLIFIVVMKGDLAHLAFADDELLRGVSPQSVSAFLAAAEMPTSTA